jgi:hypothetical protein
MTKFDNPSVLRYRPRTRDLQSQIREFAVADEQVFLGTELRRRLFETGMSRLDVVRFLQVCELVAASIESKAVGQWYCRVYGKVLGVRDIVTAAIYFDGSRIFVINL